MLGAELSAVQEVNAEQCEKMKKSFSVAAQKDQEIVSPIAWDDRYELLEEAADKAMTLAVLKKKSTAQEFCMINLHLSHDEEEQLAELKAALEKAKAYENLPTILTGTFNFRIGSPAYQLVLEQFKDLRKEVAPENWTPTYHGAGDGMKEPHICDYVFVRGVKPLNYEIFNSKMRKGYISDHNGIMATMILED